MSRFIIVVIMLLGCTSTKKSQTTPDASLAETYWKLVEVQGKQVQPPEANRREAHMILKTGNGRVNGYSGCNVFNGSYTVNDPNRISFSKIATTQMACNDMDTESAFLNVLEMVDGYYIKGDTLQLIKARMAPLAIFRAVYLR